MLLMVRQEKHDVQGREKDGRTFNVTIFASFGAYYFCIAATLTPAFATAPGYASSSDYENALGLLSLCWGSAFMIFTIASRKKKVVVQLILILLTLATYFLSVAHFMAGSQHIKVANRVQKV
jgi:succinate-acetate transporter protein